MMRWSGWIGFGATVVPLAGAAGVASWAAATFLSYRFSDSLMLPLILFALLTYLGIQVTSEIPFMAAALLLVLGGLVGGLVGHLIPSSVHVVWGRAVLIMLGLIAAAFALSRLDGGLVSVSLRLLSLGSWMYLLGWAVIALLQPHNAIHKAWALLGAVVFTGVAAAWFGGVEEGDLGRTPRYATSLYLIGVNMMIAIVLGFGLTA